MRINNAKGMLLMEILIASLIFTIALAGLVQAFFAMIYLIDISKDQTVAMDDLRDMMEKIRLTPFVSTVTAFPHGVADGPIANPYANIVGGYTLNNETITVTYANVTTNLLQLMTTISWQDRQNRGYTRTLSTFKAR